jgi:KTSC domain
VIFRWLRQRREMRARISAEADTMIAMFGDSAYYEARNYAFAARESGRDDSYWASVRGEIARRTRRDWVDTATRYLIDDARTHARSGQRSETPEVKAIKGPGLDLEKVEAAFKRAAHRAVHGTREQRSGRFHSTTLVSTKYDAVSRNLEVRFVSGRTCIYSNVPSTVYEGLLGAKSPAVFFNAFIHNHYSCREL